MVVQMLGDLEVVRRGGILEALNIWDEQGVKQEVNTFNDQDGLLCLGKGDKEFSKPFYFRIARFNHPSPPNQTKLNQTRMLS